MKVSQKIYTIHGWLILKEKRYSPLHNEVVWIGVDEMGMEHEVEASDILATPKEEKNDSLDLMAIGKAFKLKKGDKGDRGPVGPRGPKPTAGVDYPIPKNGERGPKGDSIVGPKGETGHNPMIVSKTKPSNPQEGDLWYKP